jgi:hypothetical protein
MPFWINQLVLETCWTITTQSPCHLYSLWNTKVLCWIESFQQVHFQKRIRMKKAYEKYETQRQKCILIEPYVFRYACEYVCMPGCFWKRQRKRERGSVALRLYYYMNNNFPLGPSICLVEWFLLILALI